MAKFEDINILEFGHTIQISGFILSDKDNVYLCPFPDEPLDDHTLMERSEPLHMTVEDAEKFLYQSDVLNVELIGTKKAIVRKSQRQIDASVSWDVFRRDGYRCRYCGRNDVALTVDHLILWEAGGPSVKANLLSSCKSCNRKRGNTPYMEWLQSDVYQKLSAGLKGDTAMINLMLAEPSNLARLEAMCVERQRSR